jgi:hypothetical protein
MEATLYPLTGAWGKYLSSLSELSTSPEDVFEIEHAGGGAMQVGNAHPLRPVDLVVANNILSGTTFNGPAPLAGWVYAKNIIFLSNPGQTGFDAVDPRLMSLGGLMRLVAGSPAIDASSASVVPVLVDDMDGQARTAPDVGADELSPAPALRRPLTRADVGPNSPEGVVTTGWEAERVNRSPSGAIANLVADNAATGGFWVTFLADAVGDSSSTRCSTCPPAPTSSSFATRPTPIAGCSRRWWTAPWSEGRSTSSRPRSSSACRASAT